MWPTLSSQYTTPEFFSEWSADPQYPFLGLGRTYMLIFCGRQTTWSTCVQTGNSVPFHAKHTPFRGLLLCISPGLNFHSSRELLDVGSRHRLPAHGQRPGSGSRTGLFPLYARNVVVLLILEKFVAFNDYICTTIIEEPSSTSTAMLL